MNIVIIGASNKKDKYGNKVLINLIKRGFDVIPVNPKETTIEGYKCYDKLSNIDKKIDIVVFIVNPKTTISIIKNNINILSKTKIWLQPGSYDENVLMFLESNKKINSYIYESCIMKNKI